MRRSYLAALMGLVGSKIDGAVSLTDTWAEPAFKYITNTGMRNGRGHGGKKQAHRHTGIRAQKRAAKKARNRARA